MKLIYRDISLGADEAATVTTTQAEAFSNVSRVPFGVESPAIATCELNGWGLSRDYKTRQNQPFAFWSTARSGGDCVFTSAPVVTLTFSAQYTSTGLTIRFAPESMDYCRKMSVVWSQEGTIKASETYYPDTPIFIINRTVEAFDEIAFSFEETSLPDKRCKIEKITIGVVREFDSSELRSLSIIHEVDLISDTVPVNVLDAEIHSRDNVDYIFQRKQPVEAYDGESLVCVYYIESGQRNGDMYYTISCQDAIGLLDLVTHSGGLWLTDTPLTTILGAIFGDTVAFDIDPAYSNATLRGFVEPDTTMREALQQIAFALGAAVDTSGTDKVKLFPTPSGTGAEIPSRKIYTDGWVETSDTVTEVTVTAYIISDERPGDGDEYIEYNGVKYRYYTDTKHAYNPNVLAGDPENKVKFIGMYLCNLSNAQALADNIMAYYQRRDTYFVDHVLSGETLAGRYTAQLPWGTTTSGNITKMSINFSGLTVSNTEMLLDE